MKSCLQELLDHGIHEPPFNWKWHRSKHKEVAKFIISEFMRLGRGREDVRVRIREWNTGKNTPSMPQREARRHLDDLVDWMYDHFTGGYGCNDKGPLVTGGYCFRMERTCPYWEEFRRINSATNYPHDPKEYDLRGWPSYLMKEYPNGRLADYVYRTIRSANNRSQSSKINISLHKIAEKILSNTREFSEISIMQVFRATNVLINEGLMEKVESGIAGPKSGKANGYILIYPIQNPTAGEDDKL